MRAQTFFLFAALLSIPHTFSQESLQQLIDKTPDGAELVLPKGKWTDPVQIKKPLRIRSAEGVVIDVVSDEPAVNVESKGEVSLEGVTIRWKRETSNRPAAAMVVKDTNLKLKNVRFEAPDDKMRCPSALVATGLTDATIDECSFEGFDFTIQFGNGARGKITNCDVEDPGHCGITVGNNGKLEVTGTIVTGSDFHAMRCTGGELIARNNLVIANKNRGFYLGNKAARGAIQENAIVGNGTGISGFGGSEVEIAHNYISDSSFAAIDMRDNCLLKIERNAIVNNARGLVIFKESGENKNTVLVNALAGNKIEMEGFESAPNIERVAAKTQGDANGRFVLEDARGFGLNDPSAIQSLWPRYLKLKEKK
jgi:hypothetical protein